MVAVRTAFVALLVTSACAPRVGSDCTPQAMVRAQTIVRRRDGLPAYAGQALMITSCGGGAFCHSEGATRRFGAPDELDFDPELADQVPHPEFGSQRLRDAQILTFAMRDDIYASVLDGSMPPGAAGREVQQRSYVTFDDMLVPTPIPGLDTPAGRETLRNWLACGAPMVERIGGLGSRGICARDEDCPLTGRCLLDSQPRCAPVGDTVTSLTVVVQPSWSSIHEVLIATRCTSGACHGAAAPAAGLDLSDRDTSYRTLMTGTASHTEDSACTDPAHPVAATRYIVAGDPTTSLFYRKLIPPPYCGNIMPNGGASLSSVYTDVIAAWITAGAPP